MSLVGGAEKTYTISMAYLKSLYEKCMPLLWCVRIGK